MIKPLPGYVLIEPLDEEGMTAGGLALPEKAKEKPAKGKIVAVGRVPLNSTLEILEQMFLVQDNIHIDDLVVFHRWAGQDVKDGQKEYKLVKFSDLMGVYENTSR